MQAGRPLAITAGTVVIRAHCVATRFSVSVAPGPFSPDVRRMSAPSHNAPYKCAR